MSPERAARWLRKRFLYRVARREEVCVVLPRMSRDRFEQHIQDRKEVEFFLMRCSVPYQEKKS